MPPLRCCAWPPLLAAVVSMMAVPSMAATQPDHLRFSVPTGTNNTSGQGAYDCTLSGGSFDCPPNSDFTDDIYLDEVGFGGVIFRADDGEIVVGQASKVIDEDVSGSVNAEWGNEDDDSDGDDDPFTKSGNPGANQETTDPGIRDPAIKAAFDNLSVSEGIDGEGPGFTLRFSFSQGVKDNDPGADGQPELIFFERGLNSDTRIELIIGGTFENPVKTNELIIDRNDLINSGVSINTIEIGGGQALGVVGVDLSEFSGGGFDPATDTVFGMDFGSAGGGADIFGGVAAVCTDNCEPNIFNALAEYRMEASAWAGTAGEVSDETGNGNDGISRNGATTSITIPDPAIPGDPGTCRYGEFDGADDYVEVSNFSDMLGGTATLTFWINTTQTGNDTGWQAPGVTGVEQAGGTDDIMWGWIDASGRIGVSVGNDFEAEQKSTSAINDGAWHHVALTRNAATGDTKVYVDGVLETPDTATSRAGTIGTTFSSFGRIEDTGGSPEYFAGQLDELRVYGDVLTDSGVRAVRDATHPCPASTCAAAFSVHSAGTLEVKDNVTVNGNTVTGTGNSIDPDTAAREDVTRSLPAIEPSSFPSFSGSDRTLVDGDTITADDYDKVDFDKKNAEVTFDTSNGNDFNITELQTKQKSTLNLQAGRYFIDSADLGKQTVINVNGEVELFVNDQFQTGENVEINAGGDPGNLTVNLYNEAQFTLSKNSTFTGTVYGPGADTEITIKENAEITGGLYSSGDTTLEKNVDQTFNPAAEAAGRVAAGCDSDGIDHYAIAHSGTLVSCDAETVTITAHDASDSAVDAGSATIDLSTDRGEGTWARVITGSGTLSDTTAGDGAGSYAFPDNGESEVELAFYYTSLNAGSSETLNFDVVDGNGVSEDSSEDPDLTVQHSGFRITDGSGIPISIPGQIAGKPSNTAPGAQTLALQAIRTSNDDPTQCEPAFPDGTTVEVELGAECRNPTNCAGNQLEITNGGNTTAIDTGDNDGTNTAPSYTPLDLTFGPNAEAPLELVYPDAGALQLHARANPIDDGTGTPPVVEYIAGSSNDFAVRPFGFFVDFDSDDRANNGTCAGQTSCAADADGDLFATAGVDFPVRIEAVVWESGDDSADNNGVPDSNQTIADNATTPNFGQEAAAETVDLARTLVAPGGGSAGSLSGGQNIGDPADQAFTNGSIVATGVSWDEVGIIDLAASLSDSQYLDIPIGAGVGEDVTGVASNLGRFIPARLEATGNTPAFSPFCNSATAFTYLDQAFGYATDPAATITAYNANDAITANYGAAFWKLPVSPKPIFPNRVYVHGPPPSPAATLTDDRSATTVGWADGGDDSLDGADTATITGEELEYGRNGLEDPFDAAVDLTIPATDLTDDDGVCPAASGKCNTNDGATGDDLVFDGDGVTAGQQPIAGTELRFGRLRLDDAYGPEVAPVDQRWQIDYRSGGTWVRNGDDDCTVLALADEVELDPDVSPGSGNEVDGTQDVDLSSGDGTTSVLEALDVTASEDIAFIVGVAGVRYEAAGAGNRGWIETRALLGTDYPHLLADTDGDGNFNDEPSARVTFGIFAGEQEHIYLREVFPQP